MSDLREIPVSIEQEMKTSFIDYSMSVIVSRALPDVRDGLKPVHRRILYAMYGLKNFHNKPYLKSARIVGDVIGKYHPHGDSAVYDALVRMAQNFSLRYPLIDGQGNFGSVDGDSPAAMRYTESRMEALSEKMLEDLEKDTVDFVPNYDNKDLEPVVLPAKFPQLLVNGASGIAVGMATNIPPHNMMEVLTALEALIENPDISIEGLMSYIKGPDFPTAGEIHGTRGVYDAYHTGRGSVTIRAKTEIETLSVAGGRERIVISEIPFQVNKAKLIEKIADLVREKKIEGIQDIRDESAKEEIRIVIDIKKSEPAEIVLNNLYSMTPMQTNFGVNLVALTGGLPKLLNLKEMLECFFLHRQEVLLRRTRYLLCKAEEKAHILLGLKAAVESLDQVVELIRRAPDVGHAGEALKKLLSLTDIQAKAILDMRLARLTGLEREKIAQEHSEIQKEIQGYHEILRSRELLLNMIKAEIQELKAEYPEPRRTQIFIGNADHFTMESLIPNEEVAVIITHGGYAKRTSLSEIASQKRGGKGRSGMLTKEEDAVENLFISTNHQSLLCFTDKGRVYCLKVYQLPEAPLRGRGQHLANLIKFEPEERIVSILPVEKFVEDHFITSVTKRGYIKKTDLMAYSQVRSTGIIGLKLDEGDELIKCLLTAPKDQILLATKFGKAIRFTEEEVRTVGRVSRGVTGIGFSEENDEVIGMAILKPDLSEDAQTYSAILSVCENGYGKRTPLEEYRVQSRAGKGVYTVKVTQKTGPVVGIAQVYPQDELMIITSSGKLTRFSIEEVGIIGRMTQGVRLINLGEGERVISFGRVPKTDGIEKIESEPLEMQEEPQ